MNKKAYVTLLIATLTLSMSAKATKEKNEGSVTPNVDVFISLSMPKESLFAWYGDAKRYEARLVMQGFLQDSLQKTVKALWLDDNHVLDVSIDPSAFRRHHITEVPAVVLSDGGHSDVVYGNTSLTAALETIAKEGELKDIAARLLSRKKEKCHG